MTDQQILLKTLLTQRHWQTYSTFCKEYDKAAKKVDPSLRGKQPSRAQLHRWLSGELKRLPHSDHCRVLEAMFPAHKVSELFSLRTEETATPVVDPRQLVNKSVAVAQLADVTAVFPSRSAFSSAFSPSVLFDKAKEINAVGLSLNILCQSYPDHLLKRLLETGTRIRALFLDPHGLAIGAREAEEQHAPDTLRTLTSLNINILTRIRGRLVPEAAGRLELRVYDETIRFNVLILDGSMCVVQPYLPQARGVDSPTLLINDSAAADGLFPVFDHVFTSMWERSRPI
ncbi:hypothetical protein SAMN05421505_14520 [Sinosporangium album]|uniref:DUF5919 domain-containing protein n=1 Tax=Sinosporangium album TaxID=504805 RepID=A0A1G8JTN3_9ACTN|nr:DUF5919 domain-containing protein [Sinosporangium album]SDI34485.1 hypothetical protein SAMN05421505_14520 [Sinosporangium album]